MSLLNLSPEATRLRRIAKACSAGELSRLEYREARRRVIDKFVTAAENGDEDTVPRFDLDITQRRTAVMSESIDASGRQNWLVWTLMLAVLVTALALPAWAHAATHIPPLAERDPNPATALRYRVDTVRWDVPEQLPAALAAEADVFLAARLKEIETQNAPLQHGFTDLELQEVGRLLDAIGVHDGSVVPRDFEDLSELIATQKDRRGVSLIQLERLARQLQVWVREKGYPIAQAYVPAQLVASFQVELAVELGLLASIAVSGDAGARVRYQLAGLLGQPVQRVEVETKLNTLNKRSGMRMEVSFAPGAEIGETEMMLHVKQQQRFSGMAKIDNYGVDELGEERLLLAGQWHNPRGVGDVLSASAFTTLDPADQLYGQIGYVAPVFAGRLDASAQLAIADIQFDAGTELDGDGIFFDAQLTDSQLFTRTRRRALTFGVGVHEFDWDIIPGQRAWFASVGILGHRLWDQQKVALSGSVQGLVGGVDNERPGQDGSYWRLSTSMTGWTPLNLPWFDSRAKLVLELQAQVSKDLLPPTLRMGATGPQANKGFSQAQVLLDRGVGVNAALRFDASLGQWWVFLDNTYGEVEGISKRWVQLSSIGLGWQATLLQREASSLLSRITVGYPISHRGTGGFNDEGTQLYWSLQYAH